MENSVIITVLVFIVFASIHSILVANRTKSLIKEIVGERWMQRYYRLFFTIVSIVTLIMAAFIIFRLPDKEILRLTFPFDFTFRAIQFLGIIILLLAGRHFDFFEFIGIRQVFRKDNLSDADIEGLKKTGLITSGVYGIVRHPMYLAGILIFTFNPVITVNGITVTILADIYLIFGAWIESRRYLKLYGRQYEIYSQKVPMLLPFRMFQKD
ncbi:MAG: DUF1295 domain-containing protein [Thermodesulfovibrionales bacterium]|nr:DUF1295 domain-containing protein [Thermodesulfovibrionales bacterium]